MGLSLQRVREVIGAGHRSLVDPGGSTKTRSDDELLKLRQQKGSGQQSQRRTGERTQRWSKNRAEGRRQGQVDIQTPGWDTLQAADEERYSALQGISDRPVPEWGQL